MLESLLGVDYRDRLVPFLNILMEYVEKPMPERRHAFGPWGYGKHTPRDPQEQR